MLQLINTDLKNVTIAQKYRYDLETLTNLWLEGLAGEHG